MLFFKNLISVINNLPLVISDTYDPKDISLNRLVHFVVAINVLIMAWYLLLNPDIWINLKDLIQDMWTKLLMFIGAQATVVNVGKKAIDEFAKYKANQVNNQSTPINKEEGKNV